MKLRRKIVTKIVIAFCSIALVSSILAALFPFGGILQMEKLKVLENMKRAVSVMRYMIDGLESTTLD